VKIANVSRNISKYWKSESFVWFGQDFKTGFDALNADIFTTFYRYDQIWLLRMHTGAHRYGSIEAALIRRSNIGWGRFFLELNMREEKEGGEEKGEIAMLYTIVINILWWGLVLHYGLWWLFWWFNKWIKLSESSGNYCSYCGICGIKY